MHREVEHPLARQYITYNKNIFKTECSQLSFYGQHATFNLTQITSPLTLMQGLNSSNSTAGNNPIGLP